MKIGGLRWLREHDREAWLMAMRARSAAYREKFPERVRQSKIATREKHKDKVKLYEAQYRAKNHERRKRQLAEWRSKNQEHLRRWKKEYEARNHDKILAYRRSDKTRERHANYRERHLETCPGCGGSMGSHPNNRPVVCAQCLKFVMWCEGRGGSPSRETLINYTTTFAKGDVDKWSNEITRQKAIKRLQKLLNSQKTTQPSQISEKNR